MNNINIVFLQISYLYTGRIHCNKIARDTMTFIDLRNLVVSWVFHRISLFKS